MQEGQEKEKTYSSSYLEKLETATGGIRAEDRDDQYLVEKLIARMGDSVVFGRNSSTALYRGFKRKLNREDYSLVARIGKSGWEIPASFLMEYIDSSLSANPAEYMPLSLVSGYVAESDETHNICILRPRSERSFLGKEDDRYRERMGRFYTDSILPEPTVNVEQTRVVVSQAPYPDTITNWREAVYTTCYSPAIFAKKENGKTILLIANEFSKVKNWKELDTVTVVKQSPDDGLTWTEVAAVPHLRWAGFYEVKGILYLVGTSNGSGKDMVAFVRFRKDMSYECAEFDFGCGWTSPNTVLVTGGRVYQALGVSAISAPEDADLLKRESWTVSSSLKPILTREWFLRETGEPEAKRFTVMEGNMLLSPDGHIYNIMRTESQPAAGYAAILELSRDGTGYFPVEKCHSLLRFPTSVSKFVIRRDPETGYYFSLTSQKTIPWFGDQRSVLTLVWSKNLFEWKTAGVLLTDREMMNPVCSSYAHSFQYVDFVIDGDDILMAVREAAGRTNIWHDGNYITFYRLKNFREMANEKPGKDRL